ncbi:hypothetical protein EAX61_00205 [Dokdonia sinensis]|uniref:Uncharacterized protein n=1 Tax=Dokdonia sinensis TaxID=2479847 RepID=A0A3M0GN68_9FLAO|nr:DUF6638 family protein [Dokdonia sinensis]RMB64182.1 hypothetical protein EAX61_00205 [Dokdonia sinensis]
MEKLKAAGLYGGALVTLTGALARRYNECLAMLGVAPTKLERFSIDAMGWSPEIAAEKQEDFYLNSGEANTNAIIISPAQRDKPVHMPSHSFDRDLMEAVFTAFAKAIKDITKDSALCVHIDQKIDTFFEPFDLLRYDKITVSFEVLNKLDIVQQEQNNLITTLTTGNNFIDRDIHRQLLESAKNYGDLRNRKLSIDPMTLEVKSFYTRAFGGVFVLRDFIKDILIFEDKAVFEKAIQDTGHDVLLFHISHDEMLSTLVSHLVLENDMKKASKSSRYDRIKKHRFMQSVTETEHPLSEILDSHFLFKKYLSGLDINAQKQLNGVETYFQKVIINKELKQKDFIDDLYYKALHIPHSAMEDELKSLVWKLLVKIAPVDPVHLFWYDKTTFYKLYEGWDESYKEWVIAQILEENRKSVKSLEFRV